MKEYFYILDWIIVALGFLTFSVLILLSLFLIVQRFMWWKHPDFMTYRHMKTLFKKDKKQFNEYIEYLNKYEKSRDK